MRLPTNNYGMHIQDQERAASGCETVPPGDELGARAVLEGVLNESALPRRGLLQSGGKLRVAAAAGRPSVEPPTVLVCDSERDHTSVRRAGQHPGD